MTVSSFSVLFVLLISALHKFLKVMFKFLGIINITYTCSITFRFYYYFKSGKKLMQRIKS